MPLSGAVPFLEAGEPDIIMAIMAAEMLIVSP